jgi:hypothetical protein
MRRRTKSVYGIAAFISLLFFISGLPDCTSAAQDSATATAVPGPEPGTRITPGYASLIGEFAYLWGWPMVNVHNRYATFKDVPKPGLMGGIVPVAPPNTLAMLHDYIAPEERMVACPNQDVVYGFGILSLDKEPVVVQVPDFGDRFWVYQIGDQRTDGFAELGKMYGSEPGFYLLAGPGWEGTAPDDIKKVFRSPTNIGYVVPRAFLNDTPEDRASVQPVINQIMMYPLSEFTGEIKTTDWTAIPKFPPQSEGEEEVKWVVPDKFFDQLPEILNEVPPLPGEEPLYALLQSVLDAASKDDKIKAALNQAAADADANIVKPLFQFRNYGIPLPDNWTTINNGADFGTDYFTRTAVAKSNIFVNQPAETKYFYQDLDSTGARLNGSKRYTVTFPKGELPPVKGFWSLTLYNEHHFFYPNDLKRYSLGTKNQGLKYSPNGSLTLYVQNEPPGEDKRANWLPAPAGDFTLYIRAYWPEASVVEGKWTPPPVTAVK